MWAIFSHDTDENKLAALLNERYGIDCDSKQPAPNVSAIFDSALQLCKSLQADECSFFSGRASAIHMDTHLCQHLALDALFHLKKDVSDEASYTSFRHFMDENAHAIDLESKDVSNYSKLMKEDFMGSIFAQLIGIKHETAKTNYTIPVFMSRITLLLISDIKKSPYPDLTKQARSFQTIKTFLKGNLFSNLQTMYSDSMDTGEPYIAAYLINRLFDVDTVFYLANKVAEVSDIIAPSILLEYLVPIFFVSNTFAKRSYCDLLFSVLKSDREENTAFREWYFHPNNIAQVIPKLSVMQAADANLKNCKNYLLFLGTFYLPILQACFFVLLKRNYKDSEEAIELLLRYLREQNVQQIIQHRGSAWRQRIESLSKSEKEHISKFYSYIREELCNPEKYEKWCAAMSIDYLSPDALYRQAILQAVMQEKFGDRERIDAR